ncbi:MAG: hypothetical protein Q9168_001908, partial [Polycauliona sp. 1 TL-2023]
MDLKNPNTNEKTSDDSTTSRNALNEETASDSSRLALDDDPVYSYHEQRKIIHRIDRRLIITCGVIYCFSLIDRGNLGNASIAGMTKELKLGVGFRYSTIVLVFFPTYVLFQPPATLLSRKLGPRKFLAAITLLWGALEIGFGFANKWTDMIGLRIALGILEAGLYPSVVYLLATWYSRYERDFIVRRINKDRDDAIPEKFTIRRFLAPATDIKIWILAFISFLIITVTTSISVFLPIILKTGLGFNTAQSQCLSAPC